jgi:hypothetical protein
MSFSALLHVRFECCQLTAPQRLGLLQPQFQIRHGLRPRAINPHARVEFVPILLDESALAQPLQMPAHQRKCDLRGCRQFACSPRPLAQEVHDASSVRVRQGGELNDGLLEQAEVPARIKAVAQVNYRIKNYDKAIQYGTEAIANGFADDEMYTLVAQAYYLNGQYDAVRDFLGKRIETLQTQGQDVPKSYFQLVLSSCIRLHDSACETAYSGRLNGPRDPILIDPILNRGVILDANAGSR